MNEQIFIRCNKCGFEGPQSEFRMGSDFFGKPFVSGCPECENRQNPGDASMRMFGGERPFSAIRPGPASDSPLTTVLHSAEDAS
jgi:hypothetical protein